MCTALWNRKLVSHGRGFVEQRKAQCGARLLCTLQIQAVVWMELSFGCYLVQFSLICSGWCLAALCITSLPGFKEWFLTWVSPTAALCRSCGSACRQPSPAASASVLGRGSPAARWGSRAALQSLHTLHFAPSAQLPAYQMLWWLCRKTSGLR